MYNRYYIVRCQQNYIVVRCTLILYLYIDIFQWKKKNSRNSYWNLIEPSSICKKKYFLTCAFVFNRKTYIEALLYNTFRLVDDNIDPIITV